MGLFWDLPYPPAGTPEEAQPSGVRCYGALGGGPWDLVVSASTSGPCEVLPHILSSGYPGSIDYTARGYNEAGESPDSNIVRFCACEVKYSAPIVEQGCQIYHWSDETPECPAANGGCVDRTELISCVLSAPA